MQGFSWKREMSKRETSCNILFIRSLAEHGMQVKNDFDWNIHPFWVNISVLRKLYQVSSRLRGTLVGPTIQKNNSSCSQLWNNPGLKQSSLPKDGTAEFLMDSGGFSARNLTQPLPWADLAGSVKPERIPALGGPACVQVHLRNASRQRSWVNA